MNNQKNPLVSILIVAYNAEKYIDQTLRSCIAQTYSDTEILVLDNASGDGTRDRIKKIKNEFPGKKITIYSSEENRGPYGGLNYLLVRAKGAYIAVQDHDDIWLPEKVQRQVEFLETHDNYIACGAQTFYLYEEKGLAVLARPHGEVSFVDHTSLMFRNKGFLYNTSYVLADEHFEKKILGSAGKMWCLDVPLVVHRIKSDGTNLSSTRFRINIKNLRDFFMVNGVAFSSLVYLADLALSRHLPRPFIWWIRRNITLRNAEWLDMKALARYITIR